VDVGVVQGNVSEGSTTSSSSNGDDGDQTGSSTGGDSVNGQVSGTTGAPDATQDGVVSQFDLPAVDVAEDTSTAARTSPNVVTWAMAAFIVAGLAVLYRRLPRPSRA
jgi:hypothetical protein